MRALPPRPDRRVVHRVAVVTAACMLVLGACVPVPGSGWQADGPQGEDGPVGTDVPVADPGRGGDDGSAQVCEDPRLGPPPGRMLEIVRGADAQHGAPDGADARGAEDATLPPSVRSIDPADTIGLALNGSAAGGSSACVSRIVLVTTDDPGLRALAGARAVIDGVPLVIDSEVATGSSTESSTGSSGEPSSPRRALLDRLDELGVGEIAVHGPMPSWVEAYGRRTIDLGAVGSDVLGPALTLASHVGAGSQLVLVLEDDVGGQLEVVARAADGLIPLVVPSSASLAAALIDDVRAAAQEWSEVGPEEGPEDGFEGVVSWAASSPEQARVLSGLLEASGDGPSPRRWRAPGGPGDVAELWLGDVRETGAALAAAVSAAARGARFVAVDGTDLRSGTERTARMRDAHDHPASTVEVVFVGRVEDHTAWQLDTVLTGTTTAAGGGLLPLEDRRIVALYGSPGAPSLGMLGEQDDPETIARAFEVAGRYADASDGRAVVAGLDVIATVASSAAEPTGDYSRRVPISRLRPLVGLAREADVAVFLDLQPGRTSFLDQAQEYEELLLEPHVHLALDPEWRIGPRERHLVRIGSVEAAEVQEVADWLAGLVRRERLPQKVLMLHQFTVGMLPDRDSIVVPDELVGVVHIDGQGPLPLKDRTYAVLTEGAEQRWAWGWKNFTRIDVPVATPEQSVDRVPAPVVITYQ